MSIGENIRKIRKERELTLKQVAELTDLSIPFLSQLETNKSDATMATIRLIADALEVHPSQFFYEHASLMDVLNTKRQSFYYEQLAYDKGSPFIPLKVKLKPGNTDLEYVQHDGFEFVYCLKGRLTISLDNNNIELSEGESLMYDANKPHYWFNYTDEVVEFLVINQN